MDAANEQKCQLTRQRIMFTVKDADMIELWPNVPDSFDQSPDLIILQFMTLFCLIFTSWWLFYYDFSDLWPGNIELMTCKNKTKTSEFLIYYNSKW